MMFCYGGEREETAELVVTFFEKCLEYLEMQLVGQVLAPGVTRRGEIAEKEEKLAEGYELGRRLVRATEPTAQQPPTPNP